MDVFYIIVSVVAIVTLIVFLTYIGIVMRYSKKASGKNEYPPQYSDCPDYWSVFNNKCQIPQGGTRNYGSINPARLSSVPGYNSGEGTIDFNDPGWATNGSAICNKKKFANTFGIVWDGVSNYNGCN